MEPSVATPAELSSEEVLVGRTAAWMGQVLAMWTGVTGEAASGADLTDA